MTPLVTATKSAAPVARSSPLRRVAWAPGGALDVREWAEVGRHIGSVGRNIQWLIGDWIAYGNQKFGERYARASKISGYDPQTLMNMVYVATRFAVSRRREDLSWSHHEALAALDPEEQEGWLDQAALHRWSVADLRTMLRMSRRELSEGSDGVEEGTEQPPPMLKCPRCGEEIAVD